MSHRGTKHYSAKSLQLAKQNKAVTAIATSLESQVEADFVFRTSIGETSSAFTVSHMCALTVLIMLATEIGKHFGVPLAATLPLQTLPQLIQQSLATESTIRSCIAQVGSKCDRFWFVGTGANSVNGLEAALKLKETCYVNCEGFQLEQFLHGPFCGISANTLIVFMAPAAKPSLRHDRTINLIKASHAAQAKTVLIAHAYDDTQDEAIDSKWIIPDAPETLGTFCHLVQVQLFTYWLTVDLKLGHPDTFHLQDAAFEQARKVYTL